MKKTFLLVILTIISLGALAEDRAERLRDNLFNNPKYVTIAAHRGDWRNHPENSIPAFKSCIDMGIDMIEIDVQRTKDGKLILMHDRTVDRCTNGKGKIEDMTYDEIQKLRLRPQHNASATRNHIPTLEEVLVLGKGKILINIDKGYDYFQQVYELLEKTGTTDQVIIKSGYSLDKVKKENGSVLDKVIYMPIVNLNDKNAERSLDEFISIHPVAIECCIGKFDANVDRMLQKPVFRYHLFKCLAADEEVLSAFFLAFAHGSRGCGNTECKVIRPAPEEFFDNRPLTNAGKAGNHDQKTFFLHSSPQIRS